jgi:uncharacterized membrane protein YfcA
MADSLTILGVVGVLFIATLIRSAFGFGEALIAVPLLALFLPVEVATPLAVLFSITVASVVFLQDWKKIEVRSAVRISRQTSAPSEGLTGSPSMPSGLTGLGGSFVWR